MGVSSDISKGVDLYKEKTKPKQTRQLRRNNHHKTYYTHVRTIKGRTDNETEVKIMWQQKRLENKERNKIANVS